MNEQLIYKELKNLKVTQLLELCETHELNASGKKYNLIYEIMLHNLKNKQTIMYDGFLDMINSTCGFLRDIDNNFIANVCDAYVGSQFIRKYNLRQGDHIKCELALPKNEDQRFCVKEVLQINSTEKVIRNHFEDLVCIYPTRQIILERHDCSDKYYNTISRTLDFITPIGFGQRALIVAPPKSGKTTVLHSIAISISKLNNKNTKLIILLIGERPEEVTEMKRIAPDVEIVYSTFDESPENHIRAAEIVNERAKRLTELGYDVVILMDSITRLVRSCNWVVPSSGKVLTGGVEPGSLKIPKKIFGSARNFQDGGSLTIIATCLIDTGSKMDDFIYEEFKGTGNCEIKLDRKISEAKIYPAIDIRGSGTRKWEYLINTDIAPRIRLLQAMLSSMDSQKAAEFLVSQINNTASNVDFINGMSKHNARWNNKNTV